MDFLNSKCDKKEIHPLFRELSLIFPIFAAVRTLGCANAFSFVFVTFLTTYVLKSQTFYQTYATLNKEYLTSLTNCRCWFNSRKLVIKRITPFDVNMFLCFQNFVKLFNFIFLLDLYYKSFDEEYQKKVKVEKTLKPLIFSPKYLT